MSDANVRKNAVRDARGVFYNLILPFILGMIISVFFFVFVPEMISLLHQKKTFAVALNTAWDKTATPYMSFADPNYKVAASYIAWPFIGGVIMAFLWRLYQDG